jgi:hypothetical protein
MKEREIKHCLECGKKLLGRIDKKYCNDSCKSAFLNRKYRVANREIGRINRILKNNHKILSDIMVDGVYECSTRELFIKGFNFDYFTSLDPQAPPVMYCYEIGYQINSERVWIITA